MAKSKSETVSASDAAIKELREYGLRFPGAHLKSPWPGHKDLAVRDKTFAYLPPEGQPFSIGCKLPSSNAIALMLPYCKPSSYGLGKSGWVGAEPPADEIDVEMFKAWIDESYRAQAPKKLVDLIGVYPSPEDPFGSPEPENGPKRAKPAAKAKAKKPTAKATSRKPATKAKKPAAKAKKRA